MHEWVNNVFGPPAKAFFGPINNMLAAGSMPLARTVTLAFFIGTMIWVFLGLRREYVNLEAPSKKPWHDLRIWVVVSMLPHVIVYFFF